MIVTDIIILFLLLQCRGTKPLVPRRDESLGEVGLPKEDILRMAGAMSTQNIVRHSRGRRTSQAESEGVEEKILYITDKMSFSSESDISGNYLEKGVLRGSRNRYPNQGEPGSSRSRNPSKSSEKNVTKSQESDNLSPSANGVSPPSGVREGVKAPFPHVYPLPRLPHMVEEEYPASGQREEEPTQSTDSISKGTTTKRSST